LQHVQRKQKGEHKVPSWATQVGRTSTQRARNSVSLVEWSTRSYAVMHTYTYA